MPRRNALLQDVRGNDPSPFTDIEQERFTHVLRSRSILTTGYVVTEVFRLREPSPLKQDQQQFRQLSLELFTRGDVEEVPCSLREMCGQPGFDELVCRVGPSDASVMYLGMKEECPVLTDDRRMFQALEAGPGVNVWLLREFLDSAP